MIIYLATYAPVYPSSELLDSFDLLVKNEKQILFSSENILLRDLWVSNIKNSLRGRGKVVSTSNILNPVEHAVYKTMDFDGDLDLHQLMPKAASGEYNAIPFHISLESTLEQRVAYINDLLIDLETKRNVENGGNFIGVGNVTVAWNLLVERNFPNLIFV